MLPALRGDLDTASGECAQVGKLLGKDGEEAFGFLARLCHTLQSEEFQNVPISDTFFVRSSTIT